MVKKAKDPLIGNETQIIWFQKEDLIVEDCGIVD